MSKTAREVMAGVKNKVPYPPESPDPSMIDAIIAALDAAGFVIVPKEKIKEIAYEKIRLWEKTRDAGDSENTPANWISEALIAAAKDAP